ncbi:hypothetical protein REPUB_Repub01dG0262900 [Reevesia pubescens]
MKGSLRLIEDGETKEIHLMDDELSELPESPKCPSLIALCLQNLDLMTVPSCKTKLCRDTIIHPGTISKPYQLTELSIDVNPDDERWTATVEAVIEEACSLKTLRQLNLYLPNVEILWKRRAGSTTMI